MIAVFHPAGQVLWQDIGEEESEDESKDVSKDAHDAGEDDDHGGVVHQRH